MTNRVNVQDLDRTKAARSRTIQACIPCHRSKRKCNRRKPCSQCLKRQRTTECAYEALTTHELSALDDNQTSSERENQILRARIAELEGVVSSLRKERKDHGRNGGWKRQRSSESATNDEDVYYGRSFYLGGSAAPTLLQNMISLAPNDPSDLLFAFFGGTDGQDVTGDRDVFDHPFPSHYGISEMLNLLHTTGRGQLDQQLDSYFEIVDPLHHYLPTHWILQRYERCFNAEPPLSPQELALVFAIAALGDLVASNKSSWLFVTGSLHLLRVSKFLTSPSLDTVATFCYIAVYLQHEGRLNEYWPLLGMVIRIAQSLGLHRDPKRIKSLSPEECEVRRRIFHSVVAQETALSIMFGRPTGLGFFDCDLPEDISDDHLFGDETTAASYPYEISYNLYTFQLMEMTRKLVQEKVEDTGNADLFRAKAARKRILDWYETLPESLKYAPSTTDMREFANHEGRARFVQSLVLYMIVNHNILVLFRKPLLSSSSPEAAEPCFRAAIAVSEGWKVLQDSFPRMARVTWMHWYRAFHASLICLIAIRANNTEPHIRARAITSWNSCMRIFLRLQHQNEGMRCCSRALNRLDQVVKADIESRRCKSTSRAQKLVADSSSHLRISPTIESSAAVSAGNHNTDAFALPQLPPTTDLEALAAPDAGVDQGQGFDIGQHLSWNAQDDMNYGQVFESIMAQPAAVNAPTEGLREPSEAMDMNIFDMDASNWPAWLLDDPDPTS